MKPFACLCSLVALLGIPGTASANWTITTFDPTMGSGFSTSEQIASHPLLIDDIIGVPHVAYWTPGQGFRYYDGNSVQAAQAKAAVTPREIQLLRVGAAALALAGGNEPWIAEVVLDSNDQGRGSLAVVHRAAGVWSSDSIGVANGPPSLGFDRAGGVAHVFYSTQAGPVYAWHDVGGWHSEAFDSASSYGTMRLDRTGQPTLAYVMIPSRRLYYATRSGGAWHSQLVDGSGIASGPALAFTGTGHPRIVYGDASGGTGVQSLRYAEEAVGAWTTQPIAPAGNATFEYSLALLGDAPFVAYHTSDTDLLNMATRNGGTWTTENVDPLIGAGQNPSIQIDGGNEPVIAYKSSYSTGTRYATGSPVVGVSELAGVRGVRLSGASPLRRGTSVALTATVAAGGSARLEAFDAAGRTVGAAQWLDLVPGANRIEWVAPARVGLTFLRLTTPAGASATTRVVVF